MPEFVVGQSHFANFFSQHTEPKGQMDRFKKPRSQAPKTSPELLSTAAKLR